MNMTEEAKKVRREYWRKYREKNRAKLREYMKAWRDKNKQHIKEYNAEYWNMRAERETPEKGGK